MELENIEVMYFHGKTIDGNRYTVAGIIEDDDLVMGVSICSDEDQFCKAKGRTVSSGRALNQRKTYGGKGRFSLYSHMAKGLEEFSGQAGYPENYFVGQEIKVFRSFVRNYNFFTSNELKREFGLNNRPQTRNIKKVKS